MKLSPFFERVPGRCGGRITITGRRLEPGMIANLYEIGESIADLVDDYDLTEEYVRACIDLCQEYPEILNEYKKSHE